MIKIAFCDDDLSVLNELTVLCNRYRLERNCELEYTAYQSPLNLMAAIEKGSSFDILLLDIIMPGENGMELAKEIRTYDENVKIIFLTSSPEFAVQSYNVNAFFYQLKPVSAEGLFSVLDQIYELYTKEKEVKLVLKCKTGITTIAPAAVEYCEVIGHNLLLHMKSGKVLESAGKLNDLEKKLHETGSFLRVHRSYLVNMAFVQNISYKAVTLDSLAEIPIPHGKYNDIKKKYLEYAFEQWGNETL